MQIYDSVLQCRIDKTTQYMNKLLIIANCSVLRKSPNIKSKATLKPLEIPYVLD